MKLPVYNYLADDQLEHLQDLDFSEVGMKHQLVASDAAIAVDTRHIAFTGYPHPRWLLLPKGSTTDFERRDDGLIYITCDQTFKCEVQHSHSGPYQIKECPANVGLSISGYESPFVKMTRTGSGDAPENQP